MAKKQQIILTHGHDRPNEQAIKDLKLGEVLVQHAADAKEAALHTILEEGNVEKLVSFPSTAWVSHEIQNVNTTAGELGTKLTALQTQVDNIDDAYQAKDAELEGLIDAVDARVTVNEEAISDLQDADTAMETAYKAADETLGQQITGLDTRVTANEGALSGLQTTVSDMDAAYKAADTKIRGDFATADTELEGRVDTKLAGKVDNTTFEALKDRVDVVQGEDTTKSMRTVAAEEAAKEVAKVVADADADFDTLKEIADWILSDTTGAAALQTDVAGLKDVVDGYTGKGAIKTAVDTLAGRVETNEGAITDLKAADAAMDAAYKAADTKIREDFATADTELEGRVDGKLANKADSSVVTALDERVENLVTEIEKNEETTAKALTDLDTRVNKVYEDFAAADAALKSELNGEIAKKANQADFELLSGRVADVEDTYVSTIKYKKADGTYEELVAVNNVIDLSGMVIDGGTY